MFPWPAFITYIFITAFSPGPNTITSMSNGSHYGLRQTMRFIAGVFCAQIVIMSLSAVFTSALFKFIPMIKTPMLLIGASYILWLAWKIFRSDGEIKTSKTSGATFQSGAFLQLVNPKLYLYTISSLSGFVLPYYQELPIVLGFCLILAFTAFLSCLSWATFGSVFRRLFANHTKVVNYIMAALLVYSAIALFL